MSHKSLLAVVQAYVAIAAISILVMASSLWNGSSQRGSLLFFSGALLLKLFVIYESTKRKTIRTEGRLIKFENDPTRFGLNVAIMLLVSIAAIVSVWLIFLNKSGR